MHAHACDYILICVTIGARKIIRTSSGAAGAGTGKGRGREREGGKEQEREREREIADSGNEARARNIFVSRAYHREMESMAINVSLHLNP